jgi:hypothetical protein
LNPTYVLGLIKLSGPGAAADARSWAKCHRPSWANYWSAKMRYHRKRRNMSWITTNLFSIYERCNKRRPHSVPRHTLFSAVGSAGRMAQIWQVSVILKKNL